MKYAFALILLSLSFQLYSQIPSDLPAQKNFSDSLKFQAQEIEQLKKEILNLNKAVCKTEFNLIYHHQQYRTGTILKLTGLALSVASAFLFSKSQPETGALAFSLIGGLFFVSGEILCIDSDKFLGRAGKRFTKP